ncbi:hypothetical protein cypCar_00019862, partial [Cyprinus carpio]
FLSITSDSEGRQGVCAGVCERVHQLHHFRSQREMPSGETQDHKRRRHPVRNVHAGFRHVRGASEALPAEVQRGHERRERHKLCNCNRRHGRGADRRDFRKSTCAGIITADGPATKM